ncbi:hypothetical protein N0V82_001985 [Gnomoniopsis sp. IMI 355080]|nr:hypothetical protein N0V82_001985 [Gnomoniopsis sp. IMI 355080]
MSTGNPSSLAAAELFHVQGLVAVITGGGTGIGLMMAKALEQNGAKVYIIGRRKDVLEKAAKEQATYGNIFAIPGDVTSKDDLQRVTEQIRREVGFVNLFVANAGVVGELLLSPKIWDQSIDEIYERLWNTEQTRFNQTLSTNVSAVYYSIVAFLPLLAAGNTQGNAMQSSQVIVTNSIAAFSRMSDVNLDYSASKAASLHMTKQMASMFSTGFSKHQIRFNIIVPGSKYWSAS